MRGWRYFKCEECHRYWREATRDFQSPSGVDCECGSWESPCLGEPDASLKVDSSGNLTEYKTEVFDVGHL